MSESLTSSVFGELREQEEFQAESDEQLKLQLIQEAMGRELIDSGITAAFVERKPEIFEDFTGRFYPYALLDKNATNYVVVGEVVGLSYDKPSECWVYVGVDKRPIDSDEPMRLAPLGGFTLSQAKVVASMIADLQAKRQSGELPNLDRTCTRIIETI